MTSTQAASDIRTARPLRKDAQRSRRLVLDAARDLFAQKGIEVGFDEIARTAGVGVGTVYRRFPNRDALVEALFVERMEEVIDAATAAQQIPDPWDAVVTLCEQSIVERQNDRGLAQVLAQVSLGQEHLHELRDRVETAIGKVLGRAQDAGAVRPDLEVADLVLITHLLSRITVPAAEDLWRRYLALFLDSIRAQPDADRTLPGPAPTAREFEKVAQRM